MTPSTSPGTTPTSQETFETVIRALQYVHDTWKGRFAADELTAIQTVQSALARLSLHDWDDAKQGRIVPVAHDGEDQGT